MEKFGIFNIYEYKTSCLDYNTENKCERLYLTDKINKLCKYILF